jgi:hypothetical protein
MLIVIDVLDLPLLRTRAVADFVVVQVCGSCLFASAAVVLVARQRGAQHAACPGYPKTEVFPLPKMMLGETPAFIKPLLSL